VCRRTAVRGGSRSGGSAPRAAAACPASDVAATSLLDSLEAGRPLSPPRRLVRSGSDWFVVGFRDMEDGGFVGEIADPLPVTRHGRGVRLGPLP
jgi:hypothetical protein